jgi:hypothetical protein
MSFISRLSYCDRNSNFNFMVPYTHLCTFEAQSAAMHGVATYRMIEIVVCNGINLL